MSGFLTAILAVTAFFGADARCMLQNVEPPAYAGYGGPPTYGGYGGPGAVCSLRFDACGGREWTGPTECCGDNTCVVQDEWFSSCQPVTLPVNVAPIGGKCGGAGWVGPTQCESLGVCIVIDETWSQCQYVFEQPPPPSPMPVSPPPAPLAPPPKTRGVKRSPPPPKVKAPPVNRACSYRFDACGGTNWTGPKCCNGMNTCVKLSDWFSQCLPDVPAGVVPEWAACDSTSVCEDLTTCVQVAERTMQCRSVFPAPAAPPSPPPLAPRADGCAWRYQECSATKCCAPGNDCVAQNEFYAQCLPAKVPEGTKRHMEHCGGSGQPESPCEVGTTCKAINELYSLCL